MWISRYICLFMAYSFLGWIYETTYCTVVEGKWANRGFLFGPLCPIYGTGAVVISIIISLTRGANVEIKAWQIFIISVVGSALLEYLTSWGLEKLFHAVWWDYSNLPFNLHGRISLFSGLVFGFAGLLIVYYIAPFSEHIVYSVMPIVTEALALIFTFVFAVDLTLTVTALLHFDRVVARLENSFNQNMETIVDNTKQHSIRLKQGIIDKGHAINGRIISMAGYVKGAVRRVAFFRYGDKEKERTGNKILSIIRSLQLHEDKEKDDDHK